MNPNAIEIRIEDPLDLNKVNIYWSCAGKKGQLIKKGKDTEFIYKEYGKNKFVITYGKDTIKVFKYFKFNNWHGHKHLISLSKENDKKIAVKGEVFGPDTDKQKIY